MAFKLLSDEVSDVPEESVLAMTGRGVARTAARVGEQVAGLPGDIFSLVNEYIAKPTVEAVSGKPGVSYEETPLSKVFPTTQEHRRRTKNTLGEYAEPQNKVEKFIDEVFTDATALALPGPKASMGNKVFGSLAKSVGSNVLGSVVKDLTADEQKASGVKLGSLFLFSLFDKPRVAKAIGEMYKPLQDKVGKLAPVSASSLENNLNNLKSKVTKGTLAPSEKFVFDEADAVLSKIKNGKISPEEAWAAKRSLNEKLSNVLFGMPQKADQARARKLAQTITGQLDDVLKQTAKQDPKFYKELKSVDKAFGTIAQSNWISNYIEKNMKYNPITHGIINVLQGSLGSSAATAAIPYGTVQLLYRISHSPVLAKHYAKTLAAAAREDSVVMNHEFKKLDQAMQKEEKKKRYRLID